MKRGVTVLFRLQFKPAAAADGGGSADDKRAAAAAAAAPALPGDFRGEELTLSLPRGYPYTSKMCQGLEPTYGPLREAYDLQPLDPDGDGDGDGESDGFGLSVGLEPLVVMAGGSWVDRESHASKTAAAAARHVEFLSPSSGKSRSTKGAASERSLSFLSSPSPRKTTQLRVRPTARLSHASPTPLSHLSHASLSPLPRLSLCLTPVSTQRRVVPPIPPSPSPLTRPDTDPTRP